MRRILVFLSVIFSISSHGALSFDYQWFAENATGQEQVSGSQSLGLAALSSLEVVLDHISEQQGQSIESMIRTDFCRKNFDGKGDVRCYLQIHSAYLIRYYIDEVNGQSRLISPVYIDVN